MQQIIYTAITAGATGLVSYGFWVLKENRKMKMRLKEKDVEKKIALEEQRKNIIEEMDSAQNKELKCLIDLEVADIKQYLYDMYTLYYEQKRYMPGFLKETLEAKFKYYHSHGGNGHGEIMYNELMNLPERDPLQE